MTPFIQKDLEELAKAA